METIDSRRGQFRNAMARMGAAVNVVTSNGPAGRCGITATAVCSVSDTPPTLLLCLNRGSALNPVFRANGALCINVLSADQENHARSFAGLAGVPMERRFDGADWVESGSGLPLLQQALANLQGRITRTDEVGTHTIMLVEIDEITLHACGNDSLVYFDRLFHRIPVQQALAAQA